jgi:hypothetical protein
MPYILGAIAWGAYILQDPSAFVAQYGFQMSSRNQILTAPWFAIRNEIVKRYLTCMGLEGHSPGSNGPQYLKSLIFAAYAVSLAGIMAIPALRRQTVSRVLVPLIGIYVVFYTFLEGTKAAYYFIYLIYPFTAAVVVFARWCWRNAARTRPLVALGLTGMVMISVGGIVYRIRRDAYHREYLPAVKYLLARAQPGDLIAGSHELGFTIGFRDGFVDDHLLGLDTGRRPDYILVEEIYQLRFDTVHLQNPAEYIKLQERLAEYQVIYDRDNYEVLALRPEFKRTLAGRTSYCGAPHVKIAVAPKFHTEAIAKPQILAIGHEIPLPTRNFATA